MPCAGARVIIADNVNSRIKVIVESFVFFVNNVFFFIFIFLSHLLLVYNNIDASYLSDSANIILS